MDDARGVRLRERLRGLEDAVDRELDRKWTSRDVVAEVRTLEPLHDDVLEAAVRRAHVEDPHDVLRSHASGRLRLANEATDLLRIVSELGVEELDGDVLRELDVDRRDHGAHATGTEHRVHAVARADDLAVRRKPRRPFSLGTRRHGNTHRTRLSQALRRGRSSSGAGAPVPGHPRTCPGHRVTRTLRASCPAECAEFGHFRERPTRGSRGPTSARRPGSSMSLTDDEARPQLDCVLVVGLAACAGGLALASPVAAAVATAVVLLALARRGAPVVALVGALAFLVGATRASSLVRTYERDCAHVVGAGRWPARCALRGEVVRSPVLLGDAFKVEVEVAGGDCARSEALRGRVTLHVPRAMAQDVARGDEVEAIAQLAPGYRFWNADTGDPRPAMARRGVLLSGGAEDLIVRRAGRGLGAAIDHARARLRERIVATFPADTAAMARALVLGEDDWHRPTSARSGGAVSLICSPCPACTSCSSSRPS